MQSNLKTSTRNELKVIEWTLLLTNNNSKIKSYSSPVQIQRVLRARCLIIIIINEKNNAYQYELLLVAGLVALHRINYSKQMLKIFRKMYWKINLLIDLNIKVHLRLLLLVANAFRWDFISDKAQPTHFNIASNILSGKCLIMSINNFQIDRLENSINLQAYPVFWATWYRFFRFIFHLAIRYDANRGPNEQRI